MNTVLALVARYIRPIESFAYSYLGLTVANGAGVDSASASTSVTLAGVIAASHLIVELFNDIRRGNWSKVKTEASVLVSDVQAAAAAVAAQAAAPVPPAHN